MAKLEEKMLQMVVNMATNDGRMKAQQELMEAEINKQRELLKQKDNEIVERDKRIAYLEERLAQVMEQKKPLVVNNYYMLSVPKTRDYVCHLDNRDRRFVGHFMHHTLPDDTPMSVIEQVNEMTRLEHQEGQVVMHNNYGPVNGNITTQNVEMPKTEMNHTKLLESHEQ